jgi:3-hydroxybutyryl-CoA dehydrogenase
METTFSAVGIAGAGVMGRGIAQDLAQNKHQVVLVDISEDVLEQARREIRNNLRLHRMLGSAAGAESSAQVMNRIRFTTAYEDFADVDFVIENVTENWDVKAPVYRQIDAICPPHCVFAANTSAISITRIASLTRRPRQVLGMHFMNPVPMKRTVEVIKGHHTSAETIETATALLRTLNKDLVLVQDMPGFVSNRVLMLTVNEAIYVVQDGVATAEQVDTIFRSCFGHKMGPLETADLIGLDTILYSLDVLYDSYKDGKFRPCPLLSKMVAAGLHGRKSGEGFYDYSAS